MNETRMSLKRLAEICAAYGGDPHRWPAAERTAAQALCAASAEARSLVGEASALDRALNAEPPLTVTAQLRARVLAGMPRAREHGSARDVLTDLLRWRPALPALALALVCGMAIGLWVSAAPEYDTDDELTVAMAAVFEDEPEDY